MTPENILLFKDVSMDISQRVIDSSLAFGLAVSYVFLAFQIIPPPPSIVDILYSGTVVWVWALVSFLSYASVFVGVWLRPSPYIKYLHEERVGDFYLIFEYPGLIVSALSILVYSGALIVKFGFFSSSWVAICFTLAIGSYFLFRFVKLQILLTLAKVPVKSSLKE